MGPRAVEGDLGLNVMFREISVESINPYDMAHLKGRGEMDFRCQSEKDTFEHWEGIRHCRQLIREGKTIRPILVCPVSGNVHYKYQRCDGFKRYFAFKLEGYERVPCLVVDRYLPGGQHGMSMEIAGG